MTAMTETEHYFKAAKTQWGEGKVHSAVYNNLLGRWVAGCQNLSPLKGGHDAYEGTHFETDYEPLTCKRCAAKQEEARWAPMIDGVNKVLQYRARGSHQQGWNQQWKAKKLVEKAALDGHRPCSISPVEIVDNYRVESW